MQKPSSCSTCPLNAISTGFSLPTGPPNADIAIVGEGLFDDETRSGKPWSGKYSAKLNSVLRRAGIDRDACRIHNIISCSIGWRKLGKMKNTFPDAIACCSKHISPVLEESHKVIVTLGALATATVLNVPYHHVTDDYWHGTVHQRGSSWVVPTFSPQLIQDGKHNLTGVLIHDLTVAREVAESGFSRDVSDLVVDPPIEWFESFVMAHLVADDPWLAIDIETNDKIGKNEEELTAKDTKILRINFANTARTGITVPWIGRYIEFSGQILRGPGTKFGWNSDRYDYPILRADLHRRNIENSFREPHIDLMNAWHVTQSDLPRSLGFVAPFFSNYGPWKHIVSTDPGTYAAIDAIQTFRAAEGLMEVLNR